MLVRHSRSDKGKLEALKVRPAARLRIRKPNDFGYLWKEVLFSGTELLAQDAGPAVVQHLINLSTRIPEAAADRQITYQNGIKCPLIILPQRPE